MPTQVVPYLPDEIWFKIFEYLNTDTKWQPCKYYWDWDINRKPPGILPLMLACQRFRDLGEPILYRRITIVFNSRKRFKSRERFLDTVQSRPVLCQYIQKLQFVFSGRSSSSSEQEDRLDDEEKEIEVALAFLRKVKPNKLILSGDWERKLDLRLCLVLARFEVRELQVRSSWGQFVFHYLRWGRSTALKNLRLNYASTSGTWYRPAQYLTPAEKVPTCDQEFLVSVETLVSRGGDMAAEELYNISRYVKCLKTFKVLFVAHYMNDHTYTQGSLQKILDLHQHTLEQIHLPIYFGNCKSIPNFTTYSSLKRLHLSWDNLTRDTASVATQKLGAPVLEHLSIDMDHGDQQCRGTGRFGDREAKWLTEFARCRKSSSCLKHYHIILEWEDDHVFYWGGEAERYPWPHHRLKLLKPDLLELGLTLTWNKTPLSEEQWMEQLQEQIQEHREYEKVVGHRCEFVRSFQFCTNEVLF